VSEALPYASRLNSFSVLFICRKEQRSTLTPSSLFDTPESLACPLLLHRISAAFPVHPVTPLPALACPDDGDDDDVCGIISAHASPRLLRTPPHTPPASSPLPAPPQRCTRKSLTAAVVAALRQPYNTAACSAICEREAGSSHSMSSTAASHQHWQAPRSKKAPCPFCHLPT
jgi:hypothetical protein